nr:hypothetical protein [Nocardiopsis sp. CNT312]
MGRDRGGVSRRAMLGAAAAGAAFGLAGCGRVDWYPREVAPEEYVLRSVLREKERTVARYEAALAGGDLPEELLRGALERHLSHVDALTEALPEDSLAAADGGGGASGGTAAAVPEPEGVLDAAGLRALEAAAASTRIDQALDVSDPGIAQLISGIGACEAGHAYLLGRLEGAGDEEEGGPGDGEADGEEEVADV